MHRREKFIHIFLFFFALALLLVFTSQTGLVKGAAGLFEQIAEPMRKASIYLFAARQSLTKEDKLEERVKELETTVARYKALEKDNKALRDQFVTTEISSNDLLPAEVIGLMSFVPGVAPIEQLMIDKGEDDDVKTGDIIIVKNSLIGKIITTYPHASKINLISQRDVTLTAETANTSAIGLVRGKGGEEIVLENVVLADKLEKGDLVMTKGDVDGKGGGYPPDLVIGKISSINRRASDLFQVAEIHSLVDFSKLKMVFIMRLRI